MKMVIYLKPETPLLRRDLQYNIQQPNLRKIKYTKARNNNQPQYQANHD